MAIWMHRYIVTRSWGKLSCHSSAAITWCFSMIIHGPMSQGSVHNSWKLKMSQFFNGLRTHQLSMFGMFWIDVYNRVVEFPPISSNFAQPLKRSGTTFHGHNQQTDQFYTKEMRHAAWGKRCSRRFSDPHTYLNKKINICIPSHVKYIV